MLLKIKCNSIFQMEITNVFFLNKCYGVIIALIGTVPQVREVALRLLVHEKVNVYLFIHVLSVS